MNAFKKISVVFLSLILTSCCWFKDCTTCESIEEGVELADLLLENFESDLNEDDEGSIFYNIIHTVLNIAQGFDCPEEVQKSGIHIDKFELLFSETDDFTEPILVDAQTESINLNTGPNENYKVESVIFFEMAGFYIIKNSIDDTNLVNERNESNNNNTNTPGKSFGLESSFASEQIIHITKDMVGEPKFDENNNPIYISKWNIKVIE